MRATILSAIAMLSFTLTGCGAEKPSLEDARNAISAQLGDQASVEVARIGDEGKGDFAAPGSQDSYWPVEFKFKGTNASTVRGAAATLTAQLWRDKLGNWKIHDTRELERLARDAAITRRAQIEGNLQQIRTGLKLYESFNGFPPTTEQGLKALVVEPKSEPKPKQWTQFLDSVPKDFWRSDYVYISPGRRNPNSYDLYSAGPDQKPNTPDDDWYEEP